MRLAVMGAGGIGGYLGARLARSGVDVAFVARGEHLAAMRRNGLQVAGRESFVVAPVTVSDTPADLGAVDAVLFCVKRYDSARAAAMLEPLLRADTTVLTLQNGVDSADRLDAAIGAGRTLAGAAYFPASIAAPGTIAFQGRFSGKPLIEFGEPGAGVSPRCAALVRVFEEAGVSAAAAPDTGIMLWEKFCLLAGTSAASALTRQTFGAVRGDPDMRWLLAEAIAEACRVGRARGIRLADDLEARVLDLIDGNPASGKASMLNDLERGRRLELEWISGALVRLGAGASVPTPVHATAYAALKPFADGQDGIGR